VLIHLASFMSFVSLLHAKKKQDPSDSVAVPTEPAQAA
jgi:hypothetical protein